MADRSGRPGRRSPDAAALRILVFTRTAGYRHESIPDAVAALAALGPGCWIRAGDDPEYLHDLAGTDVVCFLSTSGDVLDDVGRVALRGHVEGGGGFVGVHSALGTEPGWPWFGDLLGARFAGHPEGIQRAAAHRHPGVVPAALPAGVSGPEWVFADEWYALDDVRSDIAVLLTVDERSYRPGRWVMAGPHVQAWRRAVGRGRSWVTALGHTREAWSDPTFLAHVRDGVLWAAGAAPGQSWPGTTKPLS